MTTSNQSAERCRAPRRARWLVTGLPALGMLLIGMLAMVGYEQFRKPAHSAALAAPVVTAAPPTFVTAAPIATWPGSPVAAGPRALAAARSPAATRTTSAATTSTAAATPRATVPAPTAIPVDVPACGRAVVRGVLALNLRREPAITAPVLTTVPQFETVEWLCADPVQADQRVWRSVRYQGISGWMSARFLVLQPDQVATATPMPASAPTPGAFVYAFPVRGARVSYGPSHHDYPATDIFAPPGSLFVAPTAGQIEFVNRVDRWKPATDLPADRGGIMLSLIGDDGVRYYGSHLQSIVEGIEVGTRVEAGQLLGYTGASGNAAGTPPHLHFGISRPTTPDDWRTRRGELSPYPYLKAWERGEMLTPDLSLIRP
ncbi:MAG: M23 family metallopeptidase [Chloroflexaceae bacterium]